MEATQTPSFLARNDFLIRRLHSLSGLVPVGAFMCVHLLTNASVLESAASFQSRVYLIHSLGRLLPVVEWVFIFIPLLFHAIIGVMIVRGGMPNHRAYPFGSNVRYTLQRATGMIAFVFIMWHVFHMHGWYHGEAWLRNIDPLMGGQFRPYNAASTAAEAMQATVVVPILYAIGVLASVFHLANGLWTMGITWGIWTTPAAQRRANWVSIVAGVGLAILGLGSIGGLRAMDVEQARQVEDQMYHARVAAGDVAPHEEKRSDPVEGSDRPNAAEAAHAENATAGDRQLEEQL